MIYENNDISVDFDFARFGNKSFAVRQINSVEVREERQSGGFGYVFFWAIALLVLISAIGSAEPVAPSVGSLVLFGLGYLSWMRRGARQTYRLFLVTSSSEAQAFETNDANEVQRLRSAIEKAIAAR